MRGMDYKKLEDILLEAGFLDQEKLKEIRSGVNSEKDVEKLLLSDEIINYRDALKVMAKRMGVGYIDLGEISVNKKAVEAVSRDVVRKYSVFPFDIRDNLLFLAMQNPDDIFLIDEIKVYIQTEIKPFLADFRLITQAIEYFYPSETVKEEVSVKYNPPEKTADENSAGKQETAPVSFEVEDFVHQTLKKYLQPENIIETHIDTQNRFVTLVLKARF